MSALNDFQTYSQRENHVTNNTMLMLRHVYRISPRLLEDVLQGLLEEDEVEIGPRFEQQVGAAHSVPDAVLSQRPLNIYVEAKHGDGINDAQLERHMLSVSRNGHPENSAFLISLTKNRPDEDSNERWKKKALSHGITFAATTYHALLEVLETACSGNPDLQEIFEDFQSFMGRENLVPDQYRKLVAMLCGQSWREVLANETFLSPHIGTQNGPKHTSWGCIA